MGSFQNFFLCEVFFNSIPVSSMQIVVMICILLNGLITELIGRKRSFILGQTIILMAWVIIYFAPNFAVLITGRSVMGVGIGLVYPIGAIYLAEISLVSCQNMSFVWNHLYYSSPLTYDIFVFPKKVA
jgi:MFS family permease